MALATLNDVFATEIEDLFSAEQQLVEALPKMAKAASTDELRRAIETHLDQTRGHVERLESIRNDLGIRGSQKCKGMEGLVAEGEEIIKESGSGAAKDAALIGAAQRVEHYEIAAYGTACTLAEELGHKDAVRLLGETLSEEREADELLTRIATEGVNQEAGAR